MVYFIATSAPFFAVIFLGWLAGRRGMFDLSAVRILNAFAFFVATPALIIRVMAREPILELFNLKFFLGLAGVGVLQMALIAFIMRRFGGQTADAAISRGQACVGPNFAFLGVPLMLAFLGDEAAAPIALGLIVDNAIIIPLSIGLIRALQEGGGDRGRLMAELARGTLFNPFMLSIAAGSTLSILGLVPVGPLDRFLVFLGNAAPPTGVFALGLALSGWGLQGRLSAAAPMLMAKLIMHPLLVALVMMVLGLGPSWVMAGVIYAALPTAANVFIIAERFRTDPETVAATIVLSTALASLTFPLTLWIVAG